MLSAALVTAQRLYDDARVGNQADAERIASEKTIANMFDAWSQGARPDSCYPDPTDYYEIQCTGLADGHLMILWLDHTVGTLTFTVRDMTVGWCGPPSPPGNGNGYCVTEYNP